MIVLSVTDVNEALPAGLRLLAQCGVHESSRAGDVIVAPRPVVTAYSRPWQKVLASPIRDANPFFHMMEALWMLAGREDEAFLSHYVKDFGKRFAEETGTIHGSYGYRWRESLGIDQLDIIVEKLKRNPSDRQAVLQMWDAAGEDDLTGDWKDRPCNTHIYFRVREAMLDMTVCCRSNDIIWGAYGANAVHFAFLLDYMAARIGVTPGIYYQISNNYHAYVDEIKRLQTRAKMSSAFSDLNELAGKLEVQIAPPGFPAFSAEYDCDKDITRLLNDIELIHVTGQFYRHNVTSRVGLAPGTNYLNSNLAISVKAAAIAHRCYRLGDLELAIYYAEQIVWVDWQQACVAWLKRRQEMKHVGN